MLRGQNDAYIQYTSRDGLMGNVLYAICEDDDGYIWIGGTSGLSRFDGTYFTNFSIKDGIPDNEILKLEKDKLGRIWMLGFNGKIGYIEKGRIVGEKKVPLLKKATLKGAPCFFHQTQQNDIEITDQSGFVVILKFDKKSLKSVTTRDRKSIFSIKTKAKRLSLFIDFWTNGKEWFKYNCEYKSPIFESNESIFVRTENDISVLSVNGARSIVSLSPEHKIQQLYVDPKNCLWYFDAFDHTITSCDLRKKKFSPVKQHYFPYYFNKFLFDSHGNMWVCSQNKGLFLYPKKWQSSKQISLQDYFISALLYTSDGNLITGNTNSIIEFYDPETLKMIDKIESLDQKIYAPVRGFKESCKNQVYAYGNFINSSIPYPFGETKQLILINGKDVSINCNGKILVAVSNGLLRYSESDKDAVIRLSQFRNYSVCYGSENEYWHSDIFGLHYVNGTIKKNIQSKSRIFSNRINRIEQLPDGNLFMITDGVGCSLFNVKALKPIGSIFTFPNVNDYRGLQIQHDTIWLATNNGIITLKYCKKGLQLIRKIGTSDGLMSNDVLAITCSENNIYVSTPEGLSKLSKSTLFSKLDPPKLRVDNITVDGVSTNGNQLIVDDIPSEASIHLSALHFGSRAPLEFSYSFNHGKSWVITNSPIIQLHNLDQGDLYILVRARKKEGNWSLTQKIVLSIPLPFFKLLWVQICLFILAVSAIVWLTVLSTGKIRKKQLANKDLQLTMADLELKSLRSMMNTHFVFNALNSIQQFISRKDHLEANRYLGKFARLMRNHLNASLDTQIGLNEELQSLEHYLSLEKLRLEDRLEYSFMLPDSIPELEIPGFLLQPLIENAIWHGLMPLEKGGLVEIIVSVNELELQVQIRDNGIGLKPIANNSHTSRGLQMIYKRLEILSNRTGRKHSLQLLNRAEVEGDNSTGVIAIVTIALA